jgi:anti-sigma regulatory factor (Ser/Thr protein kinase)
MERIELRLPLAARHAATARVVAASLAADAGFSIDEIDDVRLGLNEAVAVLTDGASAPEDAGAALEIEFRVDGRALELVVRSTGDHAAVEPDELAGRILDAVMDRYEYSAGVFRMSKVSTERSPSTIVAGW